MTQVGISVQVRAANRCRRHNQLLAVNRNGHLRNDRSLTLLSTLAEGDAVQVKQSLWTLRTLRTTTPLRLLRSLYLRTFGHEVNGVLAVQSFDSSNGSLIHQSHLRCIGRDVERCNLLTLPGVVEHHVNLEGTVSARRQVQVQHRAVASLRTLESLHALRVLSQTAETEVLKTYDTAIGDAGQIHRVVPYVEVVLHPFVAVRTARHEAGNTGRIVLVGRETENLETLRGHLGTGIFVAVSGFCRPCVILRIGVVGRNLHHAALCYGFLVPRNLHGSNHCLTGKSKAAWRTVVEHIPLAVDFLYRTVGVMSGIGGDEFRTVLVQHHTARIHQHTTSAPRAEGAVAEGIAQGRVGIAQSVFLAAIAREHHHVFVANLTNRRSLEEVEVQRVLTLVQSLILAARLVQQSAVGTAGRNKRVDEFRTLALRVHRLLVELAGRRVLETIEHVGAEAFVEVLVLLVRDVLDEYRRVEVDERAGQTLRAVLRQVHGHERAVGPVALTYRCHAAPSARVGIQPIGLLARSLVLHFY